MFGSLSLCFGSPGCYFVSQPLDLIPADYKMIHNDSDMTALYYSLKPILTDLPWDLAATSGSNRNRSHNYLLLYS